MAGHRGRLVVGIDLSLTAVCVAQLQGGKALHVQSMNAESLEDGIIAPDGSVNWPQLEQVLDRLLSHLKRRHMRACTSIPSEWTVVRQLSLPDFSDDELRSLIRFELTNSIHLPFDDVVFDFVRCAPTEEDTAEGKTNVLLIAADKKLVEAWVNLLRKKKLGITVVDLRPLAKYRVMKRMGREPGTFLFVDDEAQSTYVYVYHRGLLYLSRPIQLRFPAGLAIEAEMTESAYTEHLGAELERTMDFFRYTLMQREAEFERIVFASNRPTADIIRCGIEARLGIETRMLTFEQVLESHTFVVRRGLVPSRDESHDYTAAIGLAMRGV